MGFAALYPSYGTSPPALSIDVDPVAAALEYSLDILTHSKRFDGGMEPEPIDYLATAHSASNSRAGRNYLINNARHANIRPAHSVDVDQKLP